MKKDEIMENKKELTEEQEMKLANETLIQAKALEKYHHAVKKIWYPTNYLQKMQPYVNLIIAYRKKHKGVSFIESAISLSVEAKPNDKIMLLASGVEMTLNEKPKDDEQRTT